MPGHNDNKPSSGEWLSIKAFLQKAEKVIEGKAETGYTILFFNITNSSHYNQLFGMEQGDLLVHYVGEIIKGVFDGCLISHFNFDHYLVLTNDADTDAKVRQVHEEIKDIVLKNVMDCKIGGYRWDDLSITAEEAYVCAEMACDSIKGNPTEYFTYYRGEISKRRELNEYIRSHVDEAIENGWIKVYYQPIIRSISVQLHSFEALTRWVDPDYGFLPPNRFIETLEESELIWKVDTFVIQEVCRQYAETIRNGREPVPVSINLARADFLRTDIYNTVDQAVRKYNVPHDFLEIEVTERVFSDDNPIITTAIERFRADGYLIWIDDFGSGYSTLSLLKDHPYDLLKIDMNFMRSNSSRSRSIVQSIVEMSDILGGMTLTEGVETREQFEFLRSIGCDLIQGFYFGRPMPYDECMANIEKKEIMIETPEQRAYYDKVNNIHFASETPLGIFEYDRKNFKFLFVNEAMRRVMTEGMHGGSDFLERDFQVDNPILKDGTVNMFIQADRTGTKQSVQYPVGNKIYQIIAEPLSRNRETTLFYVEAVNITDPSHKKFDKQDLLMKNLVNTYDEITAFNLNRGTMENAIFQSEEEHAAAVNIRDFRKAYCSKNIYPPDQERFMKFTDLDRIIKSVRENRWATMRSCFRTRDSHFNSGDYLWELHTILYTSIDGDDVFLYCICPTNREKEYENQRASIIGLRKSLEDAVQGGSRGEQNSFENRALSADGKEEVEAELRGEGKTAERVINQAQIWRSVLGMSQIPIFVKDMDLRYVSGSRAFCALVGKDEKDIIGHTDKELDWISIDADAIEEEEKRILRDGIGSHERHCRLCFDGHFGEYTQHREPVYINGRAVGIVGAFVEVAKEENTEGLTDIGSAVSSLGLFDDRRRIIGSPYAVILCQIPSIMRIRQTYGGDFAENVHQKISKVLVDAAGHHDTVSSISLDSFLIIAEYLEESDIDLLCNRIRYALSDIHEEESIPITLFCDITVLWSEQIADENSSMIKQLLINAADRGEEREKSEKATSDARIRQIFEEYPAGAYIINPDRRIVFWNKRAEEISGYSPEWIIGKRCPTTGLEHIDEEGNHLCHGRCPFISVLKDGKPLEKNVYLHHRDGHLVKIHTRFTPIRDSNGTITQILETFSPIDE